MYIQVRMREWIVKAALTHHNYLSEGGIVFSCGEDSAHSDNVVSINCK